MILNKEVKVNLDKICNEVKVIIDKNAKLNQLPSFHIIKKPH